MNGIASEYLGLISLLVIGWSAIYTLLVRVFNKTCSAEWNSRIVAFIHAFLVARYVEFGMYNERSEFLGVGLPNTVQQTYVCCFCLSYFIFETSWCLYMQTEGLVMLAHHVVSLFTISTCLFLNSSGYEASLMIWAAEFTNPLLQMRWFLRTKELHKTLFAKLNEMVFVILFIFMRLFYGSHLFYRCMVSKNIKPVPRAGSFVFHVVNLAFVYQVGTLVRRRFQEKKKM